MPMRSNGRDWRSALAGFDPVAARSPVTIHSAQLLLARGMNGEAELALREFLDLFPCHREALLTLGMLLRRVGRGPEAAELLVRAARAEAALIAMPPGNGEVLEQFLSAADGCVPSPSTAPAAFVAALFDESADRFDDLLRGHLAYRGPELLLAAVCRVAGRELRDLDVLDLGCGTGLAGEVFRPLARRLDGVDLSPRMLELAAAKGLYDRLTTADLVPSMEGIADQYDLIIAADVFVYVGDLAPVFAASRRALRAGGRFAFTVEASEENDYRLQPSRRYAHSRNYLARTAVEAGLIVRCLEETSTRIESTQPVRSFVCVLGRPEPAAT